MNPKYEVIFLEEAMKFLETVDEKAREKILYNIDKSRYMNDPKLFKKLTSEIWEFRTQYRKLQYRLLAFWDKRDKKETLVVSTHGIVKKTSKVPRSEIKKAEQIMKEYFEDEQ